jgi:hypothetical protein
MRKLQLDDTGALVNYTSGSATLASAVSAKCKARRNSRDFFTSPSSDSVPVDKFKTPGAVVSGICEGHEEVCPYQWLSWQQECVSSSLASPPLCCVHTYFV